MSLRDIPTKLKELTLDEITDLLSRFQRRDIAFINDEISVDVCKEVTRSAEYKLYERFLIDYRLKNLFFGGLVLRQLEKKGLEDELQQMRNNIIAKYKIIGLNLAEFFQSDVLGLFLQELLNRSLSEETIKREVNELLTHFNRRVFFIKEREKTHVRIQQITSLMVMPNVNSIIICSIGSAIKNADYICNELSDALDDSGFSAKEILIPAKKNMRQRKIYIIVSDDL